jgi:hypothetical protein
VLIDQPVELAQANLFVLEQPPQRMELNRVVLAQDFGGGGEFNRIGPPRVVSEPGFDLCDLPAGPEERTGFDAVRLAEHNQVVERVAPDRSD